jgi:hypothetical protein
MLDRHGNEIDGGELLGPALGTLHLESAFGSGGQDLRQAPSSQAKGTSFVLTINVRRSLAEAQG